MSEQSEEQTAHEQIERLPLEETSMTGSDAAGAKQVSVGLDVEGYDVTVEIRVAALKNEIRRLEERNLCEVARNGLSPFELSRFAYVRTEPTMEKWEELADRAMESEETV